MSAPGLAIRRGGPALPEPALPRRPGRRARTALVAVLLVASGFLSAQEVPYTVSISPEPPAAGEEFTVTILLPGSSARDVRAEEPNPSPNLEFIALSVSPAVIDVPDGSRPGSRVVYTFRAGIPGDQRLPRLEISAGEAPLRIGPLSLDVRPSGSLPPPPRYDWKAPRVVTRWQCFPVRLEPRTPATSGAENIEVPSTSGLSLDPAGGNAFVGIALEDGDLSLPSATTREGLRASEGVRIRARSAPKEIAESRAVGDFTLKLVRSGRDRTRAGEVLAVRVEVRGRGGLPILEPPGIRVRGPKGPLSLPAPVPISDIRIAWGTYEGMRGLEFRLAPGEPGEYTVEADPFTFLNPDTGELRTLRLSPLRMSVEPALREDSPRGNIRPRLEARIAAYAASAEPWGEAARLGRDGSIAAALTLLSGLSSPEALHVKGLLLMTDGDGVGALAALGAAERRDRWLPGLAETLDLCETTFGVGPRIRDRLPQPRIFIVLSIVFGGAGLASVLALRRRTRAAGIRHSSVSRMLSIAAALSILATGASALERNVGYAIVAASDSFAVPSEAGSSEGSFRGRAGIIASDPASGWILLRFPDGRSAWFRDGDVRRY